jgi:hypothetical protein
VKHIKLKSLLTALTTFIILACNNYTANNQTNGNTTKSDYPLVYNLLQPDRKIKLPFELNEISALSYFTGNQLICLHDEKADVFPG